MIANSLGDEFSHVPDDLQVDIRPRVLYPYHYGETDTARLVELLNEAGDIEVRIRRIP